MKLMVLVGWVLVLVLVMIAGRVRFHVLVRLTSIAAMFARAAVRLILILVVVVAAVWTVRADTATSR